MATTPDLPTIRAAIISSEFDPGLLAEMTERLISAGYQEVSTFDDVSQVARPPRGKKGRSRLAPALRGPMLIVLDEAISGSPALDVHAILKAAPELQGPQFLLFLNAPADAAVFTAWKAGIQCVLAKPFNMDEFAAFARRLYEGIASEQTGTTAAETA